jgi:hypothetical protein
MAKETTIMEMERLSDFYVTDLYDMMDDKFENVIIPENPIHGLHHDNVTPQDFESISEFGRIIKNYQKMKRLTESI